MIPVHHADSLAVLPCVRDSGSLPLMGNRTTKVANYIASSLEQLKERTQRLSNKQIVVELSTAVSLLDQALSSTEGNFETPAAMLQRLIELQNQLLNIAKFGVKFNLITAEQREAAYRRGTQVEFLNELE